jgi:undecaprenyl-diphosphatase
MDSWLALLLGMVQGITEFFPVSSSGHLMLLEHLFGLENPENYLLFNVICHLGTLCSILTLFGKDLLKEKKETFLFVFIATLPLFPCAIFIKQIRWFFATPTFLPLFFSFTALLLFLTARKNVEERVISKRQSLVVGLSQAVALFPGVSRSGTTIACAKWLGWKDEQAVRFSFLMAIPAILGAATLESYKWMKEGGSSIGVTEALIGFFASYFFGLIALIALKQLVRRAKLGYFAWYCLGIAALSYWLLKS